MQDPLRKDYGRRNAEESYRDIHGRRSQLHRGRAAHHGGDVGIHQRRVRGGRHKEGGIQGDILQR